MKKFLFVLLLLALTVPVAACDVITGYVELPTAEELYSRAKAAMEAAESYRADMDITAEIGEKSKGIGRKLEAGVEAVVDVAQEKIKLLGDISMDTADAAGNMESSFTIRPEMYLVDEVLYLNTGMLGLGTDWAALPVASMGQEDISEGFTLGSRIDFLEYADVEVLGVEKVNGVECYAVQVKPDVWKLLEQTMNEAMQQAGESGVLPEDIPSREAFQEMFQRLTIKQWYAKDTYYLIRTTVEAVIVINEDMMGGEGEGEGTIDIALEMNLSDYNQPVSIILPEEAKAALEESGSLSGSALY